MKRLLLSALLLATINSYCQIENKSDTIFGKIQYRQENGTIKGDGILVNRQQGLKKPYNNHLGHQNKWVEAYLKTASGYLLIKKRYSFIPA